MASYTAPVGATAAPHSSQSPQEQQEAAAACSNSAARGNIHCTDVVGDVGSGPPCPSAGSTSSAAGSLYMNVGTEVHSGCARTITSSTGVMSVDANTGMCVSVCVCVHVCVCVR